MKKEGLLFIFLIISLVFLTYGAEAKIFLEQPLSLYNLGQKLTMTTRLLSDNDFTGYVSLNLICTNQNIENRQVIYFSPLTLEKNKEKQFTVSFQVMSKGVCYFEASLENIRHNQVEKEKTTTFTISDLINVELNFNKIFFMPGEEFEIKGKAVKANGEVVDGFATITIEIPSIIFINETNQTENQSQGNQSQGNQSQINQTNQSSGNLILSFSVTNGVYDYKFKLPADILPGAKKVSVKIEDGFGNNGLKEDTITIASVPSKLTIENSGGSQENPDLFLPDTVMTVKATLFDQANQIIEKNLSFKIEKKNNVIFEEFITSSKSIIYRFGKTSEPGDYKLIVYSEGLTTEKLVYLAEKKEVTIELENDTLHIVNVGNVPYKEALEVTFTIDGVSQTKVLDLDLDVGKETYVKLEAPPGNYDVSVAGTALHETLTFDGVPLTGNVVATLDLNKQSKFKDILLYILIIIIVAAGLLFLFFEAKKRRKKSKWGSASSISIPTSKEEVKTKETKTETRALPKPYQPKPIPGIFLHKAISRIESASKAEKFDEIETKSNTIGLVSEKDKSRVRNEKAMLSEPQDDFSKAIKKIFLQQSQKTGVKSIMPTLIFGEKRPITTMFLRIVGLRNQHMKEMKEKNPTLFEETLKEYFTIVIDKIKSYQGIAEIYGSTIFVIFNAIKQYSHDMAAVKVASEIRDETFKFNERNKNLGIEFNIASGINTGDAVMGKIGEDKILKYLSIGDTTSISKQLEERAVKNDILISDNTYQRLKNSLDAKKISPLHLSEKKALDVYNLEQMTLRAKYKDYMDKFAKDARNNKNPYT